MTSGAKKNGQLNFYLFLSIFCVLGLAAAYPGFDSVAAFILVVLLCVSYVAIIFFLPGSTVESGNTTRQKTRSVEPTPPIPKEAQKKEKHQNFIEQKQLTEETEEERKHPRLYEQKLLTEKAQEAHERLKQSVTAQFPFSMELILRDDNMGGGQLKYGLLQKEGFLRRIEALAPDRFNVPEPGIGLEQSLMHLYGIELYAFLKALREQKKILPNSTPETPAEDKQNPETGTKSKYESDHDNIESVIKAKCDLMNNHLQHVELVNMGLQVPYNSASHQALSGTPKQGMLVEVCSFKILNRRGYGQLLKALVCMPKA